MKKLLTFLTFLIAGQTFASEVGCVSTAMNVGPNDKVCVDSFKDPEISGITCHVSYAKKGGFKSLIGATENPSRFSIACRQTGPIIAQKNIPAQSDTIFKQQASSLFKTINVNRLWDKENNSLVYLATSTKIIDGSPFNSISSVPLQPWGSQNPVMK